MENKLKLKAKETTATNKDFYSLFRPIIPSLHNIGIIAQIISGLTEAITVWIILQSHLTDVHKGIAIATSIIGMILIVLVLEVGGRKFVQVLTRAVVWKQFHNVWYVVLFAFVVCITFTLFVLSFNLSTKGVNYTFTSSTIAKPSFDPSALNTYHGKQLEHIATTFEDQKKVIDTNFRAVTSAKASTYDAKINEVLSKIDEYVQRHERGERWADSHAKKWRSKRNKLETEKATSLQVLSDENTKLIQAWQTDKNNAIEAEKERHMAAMDKAETLLQDNYNKRSSTANLWGGIFSTIVGASIVLALVCIVVVEVFRRGSGIHIEYVEEEVPPSLLIMLWHGIRNRSDKLFRKRIEQFAMIQTAKKSRSIGFNLPSVATLPQNKTKLVTTNQNTVTTNVANRVSTTYNISDADILKMALKNANQYIKAYENKPPTPNNLQRITEWKSKASEIEARIHI